MPGRRRAGRPAPGPRCRVDIHESAVHIDDRTAHPAVAVRHRADSLREQRCAPIVGQECGGLRVLQNCHDLAVMELRVQRYDSGAHPPHTPHGDDVFDVVAQVQRDSVAGSDSAVPESTGGRGDTEREILVVGEELIAPVQRRSSGSPGGAAREPPRDTHDGRRITGCAPITREAPERSSVRGTPRVRPRRTRGRIRCPCIRRAAYRPDRTSCSSSRTSCRSGSL